MAYHERELRDEGEMLLTAQRALADVNNRLERTRGAREILSSTATRTQGMKSLAIKTSNELAQRKSALQQVATRLSDVENTMQNIDEDDKLPYIGQMSAELLAVLLAVVRYQEFENGLKHLNVKIFDILKKCNDWQASFDEDEELEGQYQKVEELLA